jgi:putative nucleotidyltransferase with HDIG domain
MRSEDRKFSDVLSVAEENMRQDKLVSMDRSVSNTIEVIMKSLFAKNSREMLHSQRVSSICVDICRKMNLDKYNIEKARIAGLMHDIGKIGIPETILDKPMGLTQDERSKIQEHAIIGYKILSSTNEFAEISDIILSHHERWDGKGYPRGLEKESIPLFARIISIADTYDAMTSERPYRNPFTHSEAMSEIKTMSGLQFDPEIVTAFLSVMQDSNPDLFNSEHPVA